MLPQPGTMGAGRAFSLSLVEIEEYFATPADRIATGTDNRWWPRSFPSTSFGHPVGITGNIIPGSAGFGADIGVRPAVWVSVN